MKLRTYYLTILLLGVFAPSNKIVFAQSYQGDVDFAVENEFGDTVYYFYQDEIGSENVLVGEMKNTSSPFKTDSLVIPSNVLYNGNTHVVTGMVAAAFHYIPEHVKSITLPATFEKIESVTTTGFAHSSFVNIYVEDSNPKYTSVQGILFDKDEKVLVAYPPMRKDSVFILKEGVVQLGRNAFACNTYTKKLILPNTLKDIGDRAFFNMSSLREIILQDSIEKIGISAISKTIRKLTLGSRIQEVNYAFLGNQRDDDIDITCHTLFPPAVQLPVHIAEVNIISNHYIHLYVPRKSLHLYQQAAGWKDCASILPIEPPIITGVDTASVSWVQNFSATGYMWTLYTDEARTQRFMSLTFDVNGHLTHIDINSGHMPERMPALYHEDGEEEKRFAEYYSFTISGLSPDTKYYYTRQSLKGTEVIDEEVGTFETQSDGEEGLEQNSGNSSEPQKIIKDGNMYIHNQREIYNIDGSKVNY